METKLNFAYFKDYYNNQMRNNQTFDDSVILNDFKVHQEMFVKNIIEDSGLGVIFEILPVKKVDNVYRVVVDLTEFSPEIMEVRSSLAGCWKSSTFKRILKTYDLKQFSLTLKSDSIALQTKEGRTLFNMRLDNLMKSAQNTMAINGLKKLMSVEMSKKIEDKYFGELDLQQLISRKNRYFGASIKENVFRNLSEKAVSALRECIQGFDVEKKFSPVCVTTCEVPQLLGSSLDEIQYFRKGKDNQETVETGRVKMVAGVEIKAIEKIMNDQEDEDISSVFDRIDVRKGTYFFMESMRFFADPSAKQTVTVFDMDRDEYITIDSLQIIDEAEFKVGGDISILMYMLQINNEDYDNCFKYMYELESLIRFKLGANYVEEEMKFDLDKHNTVDTNYGDDKVDNMSDLLNTEMLKKRKIIIKKTFPVIGGGTTIPLKFKKFREKLRDNFLKIPYAYVLLRYVKFDDSNCKILAENDIPLPISFLGVREKVLFDTQSCVYSLKGGLVGESFLGFKDLLDKTLVDNSEKNVHYTVGLSSVIYREELVHPVNDVVVRYKKGFSVKDIRYIIIPVGASSLIKKHVKYDKTKTVINLTDIRNFYDSKFEFVLSRETFIHGGTIIRGDSVFGDCYAGCKNIFTLSNYSQLDSKAFFKDYPKLKNFN